MILKLPTAYPAYVNPTHKLEEVWKNQTPDQKEQTKKAADKINSLLTAYDEFGVTKYHNTNGVLDSSAALMAAEKVALMTGSQSEDHYVDLNGQQGVATLRLLCGDSFKSIRTLRRKRHRPRQRKRHRSWK